MIARNVRVPACMGGFCEVRTSCARYHALNRGYPSERLCSPGRHDAWQPVTVEQQHVLEHHALSQIHGTARELTHGA